QKWRPIFSHDNFVPKILPDLLCLLQIDFSSQRFRQISRKKHIFPEIRPAPDKKPAAPGSRQGIPPSAVSPFPHLIPFYSFPVFSALCSTSDSSSSISLV